MVYDLHSMSVTAIYAAVDGRRHDAAGFCSGALVSLFLSSKDWRYALYLLNSKRPVVAAQVEKYLRGTGKYCFKYSAGKVPGNPWDHTGDNTDYLFYPDNMGSTDCVPALFWDAVHMELLQIPCGLRGGYGLSGDSDKWRMQTDSRVWNSYETDIEGSGLSGPAKYILYIVLSQAFGIQKNKKYCF